MWSTWYLKGGGINATTNRKDEGCSDSWKKELKVLESTCKFPTLYYWSLSQQVVSPKEGRRAFHQKNPMITLGEEGCQEVWEYLQPTGSHMLHSEHGFAQGCQDDLEEKGHEALPLHSQD